MKKLIPLLCLLFWTSTHAQPITELEATPSVLSEPDATILITEVNFKNKTADWVSIVYTSPSDKPLNLKGLSFIDDKAFKTIEEDFIIASGQSILLTFKSEESDTMPYLYSQQGGLTGTTEQFIISDQSNQILDALCWTSSKPTASEIKEQAELFELEGWHSSDINTCIPSETIKTDASIHRNGFIDTNTAQDWIFEEESENIEAPPIQSVAIPEQTTITAQEREVSAPPIQTPKLVAIEKPVSTPPPTKKKSTSSSQKNSYPNGDLSTEIIITEILPNPDGSDSKKEWIELTNIGEADVSLGNWTIDDSEDGSKPYTIPNTITLKRNESIVIESKDSKLSLGNKEDSIRLFDYKGSSIDEVLYEEAPSGQSYSRIFIEQEDQSIVEEWIWTNEPTPQQRNPSFQQFTAEITSEPHFEQAYTFNVRDQKNQEHTIVFDEKLIAGPLAKATFTPGTTILLTIEPKEKKLFQFEILATAEQTSPFPSFIIPSIIGIILVAAGSSFFLVHRKFPWQEAAKKV